MADKVPTRHPDQGRIIKQITRPDPNAIEVLSKCPAASILDVLGKHGAMAQGIKPLNWGMKLCGPAITCLGPDLTVRRMAIDVAQPGDVLVLAVDGLIDRACFGAYTAENMKHQGIAGVVIDGATRDAAQLREIGFPTFAKAVTPRNFSYPIDPDYGAVNVEVCCGGVIVRPGDVIVGDDDGVIVIPKEVAGELGPKVLSAMKAEENKWKQRIGKPFNVDEQLKARGYSFD